LRKNNPSEYERIANLRDGIRATKPSSATGYYVFCEAVYPHREDLKSYQQLFLLNDAGDVVSRDIPRILGTIKCGPEVAGGTLPPGYNTAIMQVQRQFAEEVKHRQAERDHTLTLTQGQRYVLRELRLLFGVTTEEEVKAQINLVESAFRGPVTTAITRELNLLRRNGVTGQDLLKSLGQIYYQHNMRDWVDRRSQPLAERPMPRIVCSEALE